MTDTLEPFVLIPENPAPEGLTGGYIDLPKGRRLRYAVGHGASRATSRGTIVLLQGRNESAEKYFETIGDLNRMGFTVATMDWRGQGGSSRLAKSATLGHIRHVRTFADDLELFLRDVVLPDCPAPYAMLAHSMGGLVALSAMPRLTHRIERLVLTTPLVALPGSPAGVRLLSALAFLCHWTGLGRLPLRRARRIGPSSTLAGNALTSDPRRFERNAALRDAAPELFVTSLSASWLHATLGAMRRLEDSDTIAAMRLPTLIVTAGDDRVVSSKVAERLAWRMRSADSLFVPGARHELLQEADRYREPLLAAIESFIGGALPVRVAVPPIDAGLLDDRAIVDAEGERRPAPTTIR